MYFNFCLCFFAWYSYRNHESFNRLKTCTIDAGIKKYKSIIKKKKKHDKIVLLANSKLNSIEILISKALIDSVISQDQFVLINNVLKEYNEMSNSIVLIVLNKLIQGIKWMK